jgi:hypothetical protein
MTSSVKEPMYVSRGDTRTPNPRSESFKNSLARLYGLPVTQAERATHSGKPVVSEKIAAVGKQLLPHFQNRVHQQQAPTTAATTTSSREFNPADIVAYRVLARAGDALCRKLGIINDNTYISPRDARAFCALCLSFIAASTMYSTARSII